MNPSPPLVVGTNVVLAFLHGSAPPTPGPSTGGTEPAIVPDVVDVVVTLPLPPEPTGTANTGIAGPQIQTVLSDKAARAQIDAYIRTAQWFLLHASEARVGELGVPVSALQLAKRGHSVWACFFKWSAVKGDSSSSAPPAHMRPTDCIGLSAINGLNGATSPLLARIEAGKFSSTSVFCQLAFTD